MRRSKIGLRSLFIIYILISLVVSIVCMVIGGKVTIEYQTQYSYPSPQFDIERQLQFFIADLQKTPKSKWNSILTEHAEQSRSYLFLIDEKSSILAHSDQMKAPWLSFTDYISKAVQNKEDPSDKFEKRIFYFFQPMRYQEKTVFLFMQKQVAGEPAMSDKGNVYFATLFGLFGFVLTYLFLTNHKLKQLKEITNGLDKIAHGDLTIDLPERSKDEIGSIASHVNLMASKLKKSIDNQQKLEKERMELTTNLSHDVRTPLTSVIGYLRYLSEQKELPSNQRENYIQIALSKAELLKRLTDQLFLFNKLMYHEVPFQPEMHILQHLLYQQMEEEMFLLEQEKLQIEMKFDEEPLKVNVDPMLFVRLIDNLMQNIIRYALKPSTVMISLERQEGQAVLKITNAAESIEEAAFARLFDTFVTGDSSRSVGSNGLGLAIVKRIVELHRGKIDVTQESGKITFQMHFPIAKEFK